MSYHVGSFNTITIKPGPKPVSSSILERHGLLRVEGLINCRHCSRLNSLCRCTNRMFLKSDRVSATDARDLCPDSFSKCAGCLKALDRGGNKLCGTHDFKCRNLEKTMTHNKQAQKISEVLEFKREYDESTVEEIRLNTDTKKVDPRDIINLDSDNSSGEDMEEKWTPDNNRPHRFHGKLLNQFHDSPDAETTVCLRKKRKTHSQIEQNQKSIFQNHPDQLDSKSQIMLETQNTGVSENAVNNQGLAESQSFTTVQELDNQPVKREFNREVNNNNVESEESDIDLNHSSTAETRKFIDRLLFQNQNKREQIQKLEARLKKVRKKVEKKNQSLLMKDQIILNMSIAAKSKNKSQN